MNPTRGTLRARIPAVAWVVALACLAPTAVNAQRQEPLPEALENVGITEHLDERIPLDLKFRDERGNAVTLGRYFDGERPVVLTLVYYECPMLCTLVLNGLVTALKELDWKPGEEFEIVTVSIDPRETSTLAMSKKQVYMEIYDREADEGWHFLTGGQDEIQALTSAIGFGYEYLEDQEQFAHAAAIFVLTPDGRLSRYLYGVQYPPQTLRLSMVEASEGGVGSALDQIILYCFHYDPEAGRYAPAALKIMRIGGALTVVVLILFLAVFWTREARRRKAAV